MVLPRRNILLYFFALFTVFAAANNPLHLVVCIRHFGCQDEDDEELKSLITSFKNMTGLWDLDPEDSSWYHLEQKDKNDPTKVVPMGSICYR